MTNSKDLLLITPHSRYFASTNYSELIMANAEKEIAKKKSEFLTFFQQYWAITENYNAYKNLEEAYAGILNENRASNILDSIDISRYPDHSLSQKIGEFEQYCITSKEVSESLHTFIDECNNENTKLRLSPKPQIDQSQVKSTSVDYKQIITETLKELKDLETRIEDKFISNIDQHQIVANQNENEEFQNLF